MGSPRIRRAVDRDRTGDLHVGNVTLYLLSYNRMVLRRASKRVASRAGLAEQPPAGAVLLERVTGLEPAAFWLEARCSSA